MYNINQCRLRNVTLFVRKSFKAMCCFLKVRHLTIASNHPQKARKAQYKTKGLESESMLKLLAKEIIYIQAAVISFKNTQIRKAPFTKTFSQDLRHQPPSTTLIDNMTSLELTFTLISFLSVEVIQPPSNLDVACSCIRPN